ncbi:hypothetical protein LCGC14_3093630, partial [marine sediment metagenome]
MLNVESGKELVELKEVEKLTKELRERMEDDYELYRMDWNGIPAIEGKWEQFTDNYARVLADYVITALFDAKRILKIPMDAEKDKERKSLSNTERFAIGAIHLADKILTSMPEEVDSQSAVTFDGTIRGLSVARYYMFKDDDGEIVPDLEIWDPLHT